MDEVIHNCKIQLRPENEDAVLVEKLTEDKTSCCAEGNKQNSTDLQETGMDEVIHNCKIQLRPENEDGVLVEKLTDDNTSCYAEGNKQNSTDLQETGMDEVVHNCKTQLRPETEDAVLVEKLTDDNTSCCAEGNNQNSTDLQETEVEDKNYCSYPVAENNEITSAKHDTCVEDKSELKNFVDLRVKEIENEINVEHMFSSLKSLQCPFVWKPHEEVLRHPNGEVHINLAQLLTEKERGFIRAETDLFREVTIYLVLAYHKHIKMSLKEGLLDVYHCYNILLNAEKKIWNALRKQMDDGSKERERNVLHLSTAITQCDEETLNPSLTNLDVLSMLSNNGSSPQDNQNDKLCEDVPNTETICNSSMSTAGDNPSHNDSSINHETKEMECLESKDGEQTELFAKLFDMKTHCGWVNTKTMEKDVFENWNTSKNNVNHENISSAAISSSGKLEMNVAAQFCYHSKTQSKIERELQKVYALQCVTAASLAHFAFALANRQDVMKIIDYIEKLSKSLNSVGEAVILALRGAVLCEYGYAGNELGLPWIREALKLNPDNWEWNLLCAKVIGRLRRNEKTCSSGPDEEEIQLLKKAVELNPTNPSCLVHLANIYRTVATIHYRQRIATQTQSACDDPLLNSRLQGNWRNSRGSWRQDERWKHIPTSEDDMEYLSKAKKLYQEALQYGENCPYTNARCAKGLWSMPNPHKDKEVAQKAILHALCLASDDSLVNHYAGMFYEYCHDYDKALSSYEIATQNGKYNYSAEMNYINLRLKITPPGSYSPIFHLHGLLHKYTGVNHMVQTLCLRGYYHYAIEKILLLAIQNFAMAIELQPTNSALMDFYPGQMLKHHPQSINIYDVLEQILKDFEKHPEYKENKDIVEYATDILKMGAKIRNNSFTSSAQS